MSPRTAATLVGALHARALVHPDRVALRVFDGGGSWTWRQWWQDVERLAHALAHHGIGRGDRVAIFAGAHPLWPVADLAVQSAGGVSVGIYPSAAPVQVRHVLDDSGARIVFVDTPARAELVRTAFESGAPVPVVIAAFGEEAAPASTHAEGRSDAGPVQLHDWLAEASELFDAGPRSTPLAEPDPDDPAILIYTSGSTGEPKGARLTHRTLVASAHSIGETLGLGDDESTLSFLPYAHAAERIFGLATRVVYGITTTLVDDPQHVFEAAQAVAPTLFGGLPRFYEKVHDDLLAEQARAEAADDHEAVARWRETLTLGRERSHLIRSGQPVPPELDARWREVGEPLFGFVRARFGGRIRLATSGGAALPTAVADTLDALGLPVLGAYGLTEHLCCTFNRPDAYRFDSAGPAMPGTELRIEATTGEILVRRSELTFSGYHQRPAESAAAFTDDGQWLRTGDMGELDARGFLRITGRIKELLALSTGKKVAPVPIEAALVACPWIQQAVLEAEGRKFVSALLVLREDVVRSWAAGRDLDANGPALWSHPDVLAELQRQIDGVNATLSRTESVRRFAILTRPLSAAHDELTPTLKVRRGVVRERHRALLDPLYDAAPTAGAHP